MSLHSASLALSLMAKLLCCRRHEACVTDTSCTACQQALLHDVAPCRGLLPHDGKLKCSITRGLNLCHEGTPRVDPPLVWQSHQKGVGADTESMWRVHVSVVRHKAALSWRQRLGSICYTCPVMPCYPGIVSHVSNGVLICC